ncbi:MAG: hypothetical protein QGH85_00330 [Candidatus Pacebacteria bacterium]|jgi:hypothetical protein|nr:hypothetical protein [Candidatus Paceibacterota bacterium]MDP7159262.1 hypothetical protein [Candidatus Paceibacterota bacterium]MDP7466070.1 hypothetical protein [Candidatus Paceibacterota bacterium]MDP7648233.1 hypothetical protein [Candidatus Paceibacterota bacterium]HJO89717.1 hypothetical protein [Candidatus Paceibacterota bacterium]|tara:strand:+ start:478 stop:744 length:267 start_codon:yes stop_codon:yes gene_type:complete
MTVKVKVKSEDEKKWVFFVRVEDMDYEVEVKREDYERLTGGKTKPEELVEKSFEFLLAREPKESILKQFNLMEIARYFPEYEREISQG